MRFNPDCDSSVGSDRKEVRRMPDNSSDSKFLTKHDLLDMLTRKVEQKGTQRAVAEELGISAVYLGDVLRGRRKVGRNLALRLGFERVVAFKRMD